MRNKRFVSSFMAFSIVMTTFSGLSLTASATKGPEKGVYLCRTTLGAGEYMRDNLEKMEGEQVVGRDGCVAHFSSDGVLTLGGTLTLNEAREGAFWGAIGGVVGASDLAIQLLPEADITLNSTGYSGIYGNYEPLLIQGDGKITINTSANSNGGILVYGKDNSENTVPTGITITDGADVSIIGTKGIVLSGEANGDISVTNGAALTVKTQGQTFSKAPVIEPGSMVTVGSTEADAAEWDGTTALTTYNYVKIEAPDGNVEEPTPTVPAEDPTPEVTEEIPTEPVDDPDLPKENFSPWIGIQLNRDGALEWLYDKHYIMPDGSHMNETAHGAPDGSEAVYYNGQTGTLSFKKDITIYGSSKSDEYVKYYGSGLPCAENTNLIIHLNDGVNVTVDAANRTAYTYLYGLYLNGHLVIEGDGTLTIKTDKGTADNYALCVFNGQDSANSGSVLIKNNARVVLEAADENGIGIGAYGSGAGDIIVKDGAVLEAKGGKQALGKAPVIPEGALVMAGSSASDAVKWDGISDITQYKYIKINSKGGDEPDKPTPSAAPETPTPTIAVITPTPATPTPTVSGELPKKGIIWQDDFERYSTYDWKNENLKNMRVSGGGDYNNIYEMNIDIARDHGKVLKATTNKTANRGLDFYPKDIYKLSNHEDINSGTLVISADVSIPGDFVMNSEDQELNDYIWTWSKSALNGSAAKNLAYIFKVGTTYGDSTGKISFQTGNPSGIVAANASNSINISFDTWHSIDAVINYDAGTVDYYVDGNLVTSYPGTPDDVIKYFSFAYMGLHQNGRYTTSDKPLTILWDNFKLELIDSAFSADTADSGENYADIRFTKPVSDNVLKNAIISLQPAGNSSGLVKAENYTRISGDTIRVFFNNMKPATAYEIVFGSEIESAYGGGIIPADTKLVFTTNPKPTAVSLINMSFDDAGGNYNLVHSASAENLSFVDDPERTSEYVSIKDGVLYYDHYLDTPGQERNGLKFPFANDTRITNGTLIVEFDAGISGETGRTRAIFGIEDPDKTDCAWTPATVFGGIAPYDGARLSFARAMASSRNSLTGDSGIDITAAVTGQEEMHHYKIVVDIDNSAYKLYYDGALAADLDYIPGGYEENSFDAFMLTGVHATSVYAQERGKTFIMLDNLSVTAETVAASVDKVSFIKYDGNESVYTPSAPAGTKEIRIEFTKEMAADTAEHITLAGLSAEDYTVASEGKTARIAIKNCLDAHSAYTLKVDGNAADITGNQIAGEAVYQFTADDGEVVYCKPVIKTSDTSITAEVSVINTTADDIDDFYITLAGYNDEEKLISVTPLKASYKKSEGYTKTFTVTGDTSKLNGAARIASFVFSDLTYIRPLTECAEIRK